MYHGFLRARNGLFITFDAPGAVVGMIGTFPSSINLEGSITAYYYDVNSVVQGFLRARNGKLITFDAPGAGTTSPGGAQAFSIHLAGAITGVYTDANAGNHGFLRARDGTIITFDPPGPISMFGIFGIDLFINPEGVITGAYKELDSTNPFGGNYRVFVRTPDGDFTTFDAATYAPCCIWSFPYGITPAGAITGSFNDGYNINHGFLRATDRTLTTFDVPAAGTSPNQGTVPLGITPAGEIMGLYADANNRYHGFLFLPKPWVSK